MSMISPVASSLAGSYAHLASGKQINGAADNAAGLAIVQKQDSQINGYNAGANNMAAAKDALNIADGALGSITDYLQRIRELAVGASNTATVSDSDRAAMQDEVSQLLQGIQDVADNTSYNTKPLLDGTQTDFKLATDGNGNMSGFGVGSATLEALGIKDFDLTGDFDIRTIDDAISKVSSSRSKAGAQSAGFEYAIHYNSYAAYNLTAAKSRIEDLDFPQAVSEQKKQQALLQYAYFVQRRREEDEAQRTQRMFASFV